MVMCISPSLKCLLNNPMKLFEKILTIAAFSCCCMISEAQTAHSLFWRSDSLQVSELTAEPGNHFNKVGHHGPAIENSHMALRIYFNDSGAVDVYSKTGRGMELMQYRWYPTPEQQDSLSVGTDGYIVGKTVGLGGVALWDDGKVVRLDATAGRVARAGDTKKGSYAEVISYGVPYGDGKVDISVRVDVLAKTREAVVTATEINGRKVCFVTGVNFHDGQRVTYEEGYVSVWGPHPVKKTEVPFPIGAGLFYSEKDFPAVEKTEDMVRLVSKPLSRFETRIISASSKEAELNNAKRFEAYMSR